MSDGCKAARPNGVMAGEPTRMRKIKAPKPPTGASKAVSLDIAMAGRLIPLALAEGVTENRRPVSAQRSTATAALTGGTAVAVVGHLNGITV